MTKLPDRWLVDVTGIEPATPCLQSKLQNAMWLYRLAFTYVLHDGFRWYSAVVVPILFPLLCRKIGCLIALFLGYDLPWNLWRWTATCLVRTIFKSA